MGFQLSREQAGDRRVSIRERKRIMTYIEPTPPGGPSPEVEPGNTPGPEIDPSDTPDEIPQPEPGGGGEGDSRPHD